MAVKPVLLLGNPKLYEKSFPVKREEIETINPVIRDLHDTLIYFREKYGKGRAIAAPQIEMRKRIIYMQVDEPVVFINPVLDQRSKEMIEIWDDCMSFPYLLVKVARHKKCRITYRDLNWKRKTILLGSTLSELLQHECDHLDGILAVSRAIDGKAFALSSQKQFLK